MKKEEQMRLKPEEIEARSMEIIAAEMPHGRWSPAELAVVKRCIHTSADFDYAQNLYFSPHAALTAVQLFRQGVTIVTDTNMALAGINKKALERCHSRVTCFMAEEAVASEAKARGVTRASVSMEYAARLEGPVLFAIGNAPTALMRLYELIQEEKVKPAFIIGAPVGFVNVIESKELLCSTTVPCIVPQGRKGGSNIAAAICNALLYLAGGRE